MHADARTDTVLKSHLRHPLVRQTNAILFLIYHGQHGARRTKTQEWFARRLYFLRIHVDVLQMQVQGTDMQFNITR